MCLFSFAVRLFFLEWGFGNTLGMCRGFWKGIGQNQGRQGLAHDLLKQDPSGRLIIPKWSLLIDSYERICWSCWINFDNRLDWTCLHIKVYNADCWKKGIKKKNPFHYVLISISPVLRYEPALWKPKIGMIQKRPQRVHGKTDFQTPLRLFCFNLRNLTAFKISPS